MDINGAIIDGQGPWFQADAVGGGFLGVKRVMHETLHHRAFAYPAIAQENKLHLAVQSHTLVLVSKVGADSIKAVFLWIRTEDFWRYILERSAVQRQCM